MELKSFQLVRIGGLEWREPPFSRYPEAPGAFNGRPDPSIRHPGNWWLGVSKPGGLKATFINRIGASRKALSPIHAESCETKTRDSRQDSAWPWWRRVILPAGGGLFFCRGGQNMAFFWLLG